MYRMEGVGSVGTFMPGQDGQAGSFLSEAQDNVVGGGIRRELGKALPADKFKTGVSG